MDSEVMLEGDGAASSPPWGTLWAPEGSEEDTWVRWSILHLPEGFVAAARCQRCGARCEWWPDHLIPLETFRQVVTSIIDEWSAPHRLHCHTIARGAALERPLRPFRVVLPATVLAWRRTAAALRAEGATMPDELLGGILAPGHRMVTALSGALSSHDRFARAALLRRHLASHFPGAKVLTGFHLRETRPGFVSVSLLTWTHGVVARVQLDSAHGDGPELWRSLTPAASIIPGLEGFCRPLPVRVAEDVDPSLAGAASRDDELATTRFLVELRDAFAEFHRNPPA